MAMEDFTRHQQGIIKRYYANADKVALQKLAEQVTELYLAAGAKRQRVWKAIVAALVKLEVPQARIDHLVQKDDPALLAQLVTELQGKQA
jgi:hypothetical protein